MKNLSQLGKGEAADRMEIFGKSVNPRLLRPYRLCRGVKNEIIELMPNITTNDSGMRPIDGT
jgi:hypothetical protein